MASIKAFTDRVTASFKASPKGPSFAHSSRLSVLVIVLTMFLHGCASTGNQISASASENLSSKYHIGAADVLMIKVWNRENLDRKVTVRPDGKISFPLIGDVYVAGLEPSELQVSLEEALRQYMKVIPGEVSVTVDEVHSYKISVLGEVRAPGRFEFQSQVSILEALAQAGGLTEFATSNRILVIRNYLGIAQEFVFDYQKTVKRGGSSTSFMLVPGDVVLVP